MAKKRGRPKGSKNKKKTEKDTGGSASGYFRTVCKRGDGEKTYNLSYGKGSKKLEDVLTFNGSVWETEEYPIPAKFKLKRDALASWGEVAAAAYENGGVAPTLSVESDIEDSFVAADADDIPEVNASGPMKGWDEEDEELSEDEKKITTVEALVDLMKLLWNFRNFRESVQYTAAKKTLLRLEGIDIDKMRVSK